MIHPAPTPELVDALGAPLRQETLQTFAANPEPVEPWPLSALEAIGEIARFGEGPYAAPRLPFDKITSTKLLPTPGTEERGPVHYWVDEQRRILFCSPELFERIREALGSEEREACLG